MKNDSTSFFENNHFANSYVYDISISHVPAYFGLHWHHYIEIVLAQDNGIIYEVNGETFPLKPGASFYLARRAARCFHNQQRTSPDHASARCRFSGKTRGFPVCCLSFLSDPSSKSEQLPGNRKTPRISDRAAQALPLRYQFFRAARMRSAVSVFYSARRKSLRADRNCRTAKNRPFRTGTPPDDCCMYLDLESLHRTGFSGRSIKGRRILPLPFFQAVPAHTPASHPSRISSPGNGSISPKTC